jgi:hypothetical protein
MKRTPAEIAKAKKNAAFFCRDTKVSESADCHGLPVLLWPLLYLSGFMRTPECISGSAGDGGRKDYIQLKIGRRKAASAWSNSGETACFYKSYKRGLLFQSHKRKIGGEENLISAVGIGSWRSPCPMRTNRACPHNDEIRTTGLLYPLP